MIMRCAFRNYFMFESETSTIGDNDLLDQQKTIIRQYSKAILISGIFGIVYEILSGFPYLGVYLFFGLPFQIPSVAFHSSSLVIIAFSSLVPSYISLGIGVLFLSRLYRKAYYSKKRRLFYRGLLYLLSAYTIWLIMITIIIMISGIKSNPTNQPTQLYSIILSLVMIYTMFTFSLTIFFVITSFALRTKNQYFILLAFIAAPDVYFLPIIAGLLGLIMTSAQGNTASKLLYAEVTRKIRRIELRITAIVYRIKYLDRRRYNKYVYPLLALSILATTILLYYSLIIKYYFVYEYKFYYHPYHFGPNGISNGISLMCLIAFDLLLIKFLTNGVKSINLIVNASSILGITIVLFSGILMSGYPGNYPRGLLEAYSQSLDFSAFGVLLGTVLISPKNQKKLRRSQLDRNKDQID